MAAVAGMAMLAAGMEEAVIRAALAGMGLVQVGTSCRWLASGVALTGTVVTGMAGGSWHHGGHGGGWGGGPAIGLGVGLGLLGGALATAPYYGGYDYDYGYDYAPYAGTPAPTVWYWCDAYQGYYPSVPECPVPWREVVQ